jgi:hypothetical protein
LAFTYVQPEGQFEVRCLNPTENLPGVNLVDHYVLRSHQTAEAFKLRAFVLLLFSKQSSFLDMHYCLKENNEKRFVAKNPRKTKTKKK